MPLLAAASTVTASTVMFSKATLEIKAVPAVNLTPLIKTLLAAKVIPLTNTTSPSATIETPFSTVKSSS